MTKNEAIALLGGSMATAAVRIGVTIQAISSWPPVLSDRLKDRVEAVLYRDLLKEQEAKRKQRRKGRSTEVQSETACDKTA